MVDNGVPKRHIVCGCGKRFSDFAEFKRHQNQPGHVDVGETYLPVEGQT